MQLAGFSAPFLSLFLSLGFNNASLTSIDTVRAIDTLDIFGDESFCLAGQLGAGLGPVFAELGAHLGTNGTMSYYDSSAAQRVYVGTGSDAGAYAEMGLHAGLIRPMAGEIAAFVRAGHISVQQELDFDTCAYDERYSTAYTQLGVRLRLPFGGISYAHPAFGSGMSSFSAFVGVPINAQAQLSSQTTATATVGAYYEQSVGPETNTGSLGCLIGGFGFGGK